ncbi:hypothetical protein ACSU64_27880 [Bacillaceae bacterium C204]|uniref:hypothetical protein n=1 Tax=Neobacillus sp. 204 TaxID=3383351 RepID=UPI003979EB72
MPTVGFNVSEEYKDHVKQLIANMGLDSEPGTWFKKAVSLMELQNIQEGSEFAEDLKEFEGHALRLYEIMDNIVKRSLYKRDDAVRKVQQELDQKEQQVIELQEKARAANEAAKDAREYAKKIDEANDGLLKQLNQVQATNDSNAIIIKQYQEKIDDLSGIITEYKGYKEENDRLKKEHATEIKEMESAWEKAEEEAAAFKDQVRALQYELKAKDVERDKAVLQVQSQLQAKLQSANEEYNDSLKGLYEEINKLKSELFEQKDFEALLKQIEIENEKRYGPFRDLEGNEKKEDDAS